MDPERFSRSLITARSDMKKVFITTLGCKVNQFESAAYFSGFAAYGITSTRDIEEANFIVINTCAVTAKASSQSKQEIRKALRSNQRAQVIVTGCHAELASKELLKEHTISAQRLQVIGNVDKNILVSQVLDLAQSSVDKTVLRQISDSPPTSLRVDHFPNRTRAFLKVQDGCDSFCSYCIVPYTRGRSRSMPLEELIKQAQTLERNGHQEIVVTGIHVGMYGKDLLPRRDIADLLETLCQATPQIRYRLSSIEPTEISWKLLTLMRDLGNFMPHFHIPLQSGDNEILKNMNRHYSREEFKETIEKCRSIVPEAAIGLDVLVGFPGESKQHFMNTQDLIQRVDCTYLHVFPYSRRPGTKAAEFSDEVAKQTKKQRVEILRSISSEKSLDFYARFLHTKRDALIEHQPDRSGMLKGFTDNYIPVRLNCTPLGNQRIITVELQQATNQYVEAINVT